MSAVAADPSARVLVIDDDHLFLEIIGYHLERSGYQVEVAADPREGLNQAIEGPRSRGLCPETGGTGSRVPDRGGSSPGGHGTGWG